MNLMTVNVPIADPGGDDKQLFIFRAPESYGGCRLVQAEAVNKAATAGGTTFTYCLHKYSNAGTPAVNGTITDVLGGTASYWADGVPKEFTIDTDYSFLDAGEWLVVDYQELNSGSPTLCALNLKFEMGK